MINIDLKCPYHLSDISTFNWAFWQKRNIFSRFFRTLGTSAHHLRNKSHPVRIRQSPWVSAPAMDWPVWWASCATSRAPAAPSPSRTVHSHFVRSPTSTMKCRWCPPTSDWWSFSHIPVSPFVQPPPHPSWPQWRAHRCCHQLARRPDVWRCKGKSFFLNTF